jgi:hypothetical protein
MKTAFSLIAAGLVALALVSPAPAASLLGGLIRTGVDSGNGSGLVTSNQDGSIGIGGSNGASVDLGGLGGALGGVAGGGSSGGLGGLGGLGSGSTGVPGVAEVSTGQSSGGGTSVGVSLLGGGSDLSLNPLGLLGDGGSLTASLPGLGGLGGLGGTPGAPGQPGAPGAPGGNGSNGFNGFGGYNGYNGYNGAPGSAGVTIPGNVSSRLRSVLAVLAARDWIRMVNGRAICLGRFGSAEISSLLPRKDWAGLNAALPQYAEDIATLRQLLANCLSPQQRQALNVRDLNRVVGIDVGRNGTPVVYFL